MKTVISKKIITISLCLFAVAGFAAGSSKEQALNKQIATLESKVFALETENKKLKKELDQKNKAITSLAMRLAQQPIKASAGTASRKQHSSSSVYNSARFSKAAAEQQKKQRARLLAVTNKKIAYYEKQKADLEKDYKAEQKKIKDARYLIKRDEREDAIKSIQETQERIKWKIAKIDKTISSLQRQTFNYQ